MTDVDPTTVEEIRRTFSYSEREQRVFPPLRVYAERITPELDRLLTDPAARERFMLAGLFLSYRTANHQGLPLTTEVDREEAGEVYVDDRILGYHRLGGPPIRSAREYRERIGFRPLRWRLIGLGRALARFVERG